MTPQKGGYIVIDCTPLWIDNDGIDYDKDGSFGGYAQTNQEINKILYNALINKKPIILNNLKIYDVTNESNYMYNGLVAHTVDFTEERGGYTSIDICIKNWDLSFECYIDSNGEYSLSIYGRYKQ